MLRPLPEISSLLIHAFPFDQLSSFQIFSPLSPVLGVAYTSTVVQIFSPLSPALGVAYTSTVVQIFSPLSPALGVAYTSTVVGPRNEIGPSAHRHERSVHVTVLRASGT